MSISGSGSGTSGSFVVTAGASAGTGTCTVTASNVLGTQATGSASVTVVLLPSVVRAVFSPTVVGTGTTSQFSWSSSNATSGSVTCVAPAFGSSSGTSGNLTVTTSGTGTGSCTYVASNAAGTQVSASANLTVNPGSTTLTANPTSLSFSVASNGTQTKSITITNAGPAVATGLTINITNGGTGTGYFTTTAGGTCSPGATLGVGGSCTLNVEYVGGCGVPGSNSGQLIVSGTGVGTAASPLLSGGYSRGMCQ